MDAEFVEQILRFDQDIDQMRHRRTLVAADIGHTRLQDRLGDGEDAFAAEDLALAQSQRPHLLGEGALRIGALRDGKLRLIQHAGIIGANGAVDDPVCRPECPRHGPWRSVP